MCRVVLMLVALAACKEKAPEPPPPAPPHDGVTLLQPGAAPFQPLRYHPTKGAKTTSELVSDIDVKTDGQPGPMPTIVVDFETTIDDVLADGTAKLRITVLQTTVRERPGTAVPMDLVREQAAAMQGVVITETLAPDGKLSDARVDSARALPDKVREQLDNLSQNLEQVAMRMPTEPVGIGATWRERKTLPEGGIRAVTEVTYTLTSRTGDTIGYTSTGVATGGPQTIEHDGTRVEVTNTHGGSQARGSVDLSRYAVSVTSSSSFATTLNVLAPKGTPGAGLSTLEITTAIQVSPAESPSDPTAPAPPNAATPNAASPASDAPKPPSTAPAGTAQGAHRAP